MQRMRLAGQAASFALAAAAALAFASVSGCSHDMPDHEYCARRQMGWEMAFPNLTQTDDDRTRFIDRCVTAIAAPAARAELPRSLGCMNEYLLGHGHAYEQYLAFTRCEGVDPTRER
jgi:hypothetical protein